MQTVHALDVCMSVCMYVCIYISVWVYVCMYLYICMYVCTHVYLYVCIMYVCTHVRMYVCMYVCIYLSRVLFMRLQSFCRINPSISHRHPLHLQITGAAEKNVKPYHPSFSSSLHISQTDRFLLLSSVISQVEDLRKEYSNIHHGGQAQGPV